MKRIFALLMVAWPAVAGAQTRPLDLPVWRAGSAHAELPAYSGDCFSIRLKPAAAHAALAGAHARPIRTIGVASVDAVLAATGATLEPEFRGERPPAPGSAATDFTAFYLVHLPPGQDLETGLARFESLGEVERVSPIGLSPVTAVPNDSTWSQSWWLYQDSRIDVHAPEAWDLTRGDSSIVVALIDTGLIPYHPEIGGTVAGGHGHLWNNPAEANGIPGVDDDGNGFVDDVWGWDFVNRPLDVGYESPGEDILEPDGDPNDFVGHGTIVAGLVGAITDNRTGVVGMDWNARLMPLRVGWSMLELPTGVVSVAFMAQAVRYATLMGAKVINISLSSAPYADLDLAVDAAIAAGVTVVVAAGNNGSLHGISPRPGLIYVAATDRNDRVPIWSNVGTYVDLCAPGADLISTNLIRTGTDSLSLRQPGYAWGANGTSFATPVVSGAVALLQSYRRQSGLEPLTPEQVRLRLIASSDDISGANPSLVGFYGAGRLDVAKALTIEPPTIGVRTGLPWPAPLVDFTTLQGERRLAFVTSAASLEFLDAATLERTNSAPLEIGDPEVGLAAADLGGGHGLGFFVSSRSGFVGGYGGGGRRLPGWPIHGLQGPLTVPALGDLDGDGALDVVSIGPDPTDLTRGLVWAWTAGGAIRPGFPIPIGSFAGESVGCALADLDGVLGVEVVVAEGTGLIHAFRASGAELPGWPVQSPGGAPAAPVVGRGPSSPVVWIASRGHCNAYDASGAALVSSTVPSSQAPFDPLVVDLDGDGSDDLIVSTADMTYAQYSSGAAPGASVWPVSLSAVGAPLAGHLSPDDLAGVLIQSKTESRGLTRDGLPIASFNGAGVVALTPTLARPDAGGRTTVFTAITPGGWFYSYSGAPQSWTDTPQAWPTQRANFARTGSLLGAPPLASADDHAPQAVTDLAATALSATRARLIWTSPADDAPFGRAVRYDMRLSDRAITPVNFATLPAVAGLQPPRTAGARETLEVSVAPGLPWFARLKAVDGSGNWSDLSDQATALTPSSGIPSPVGDLRITAVGDTTLALSWSATGEDQNLGRPSAYDIRAALVSINNQSYANAPFRRVQAATVDAGGAESATLGGLPTHTTLFVAMRALDHEGYVSVLSNVASAQTRPSARPAAVRDLRGVSATESTITVSWTAVGDDEDVGRPDHYEVGVSSAPLSDSLFSAAAFKALVPATTNAGGSESATLGPFGPDSSLWLALEAVDHDGNRSSLSNVIEQRTLPARRDSLPPAPALGFVVRGNPVRPPVTLAWSAAPARGGPAPTIRIHDLNGRLRRRFVLPPVSSGVLAWDGNDEEGRRLTPGVYFATYIASGAVFHRKLVLLPP